MEFIPKELKHPKAGEYYCQLRQTYNSNERIIYGMASFYGGKNWRSHIPDHIVVAYLELDEKAIKEAMGMVYYLVCYSYMESGTGRAGRQYRTVIINQEPLEWFTSLSVRMQKAKEVDSPVIAFDIVILWERQIRQKDAEKLITFGGIELEPCHSLT